jgi:hypothetical protein
MRYTDIQKTPTGYTLRHSRATKLMTLIPCSLFAIPATVLLFFELDIEPYKLIPTALAMVLSWVITAYLFSLAFGYRIVIDETGVHRYSFGRVKHSLLWRYVRSFGIGVIPVPSRYGQTNHLAFYASTEAKPIDYKSKVFIKLTPADEQAIRESGLITFCRRQMADADRHFQ